MGTGIQLNTSSLSPVWLDALFSWFSFRTQHARTWIYHCPHATPKSAPPPPEPPTWETAPHSPGCPSQNLDTTFSIFNHQAVLSLLPKHQLKLSLWVCSWWLCPRPPLSLHWTIGVLSLQIRSPCWGHNHFHKMKIAFHSPAQNPCWLFIALGIMINTLTGLVRSFMIWLQSSLQPHFCTESAWHFIALELTLVPKCMVMTSLRAFIPMCAILFLLFWVNRTCS